MNNLKEGKIKINKEKQKEELPTVSFVTPTYNSSWFLKDYLNSIEKQDYPKEKIEILFVDGGSTDDTLKIAKKHKIKVIKNKLILGDPGFAVGAEAARGDFMVFIGHDNRLIQKNWIRLMLKPLLQDKNITAAFPHLESKRKDSWLTKYVNRFTDPGNHFVYGYANNPLTFNRVYQVIKKTKDWIVFDFKLENHPILEFEQGFMIRKKGYHRDKETWYCGILAVIDLIKDRKRIAYVLVASNYHDTLNSGLKQFIKKTRWAADYNLDKRKTFGLYKRAFGLKARKKYLSPMRRLKIYLYPFYGISFVFPTLRAVYFYLKDREIEWLYHPFITFISASILWIEAFKIKILKRSPIIERY